jgi:NAD(P)-dependent dehydrogenase (short-subunit alcohol dehydrogenase family)
MSQQQVALVSGASRGIGREIARLLSSQHGFLVLAGARDPRRVDLDGSVVAVALDVTDAASVDAALSSIAADPGRLDVLVTNAGVEGPPDGAGQLDLVEAHAVLETNLSGAWRLLQAPLPLLRRSSDARIVNKASRTEDAFADGSAPPVALVDGAAAPFLAGALIAGLGILATLALIRCEALERAPENGSRTAAPMPARALDRAA